MSYWARTVDPTFGSTAVGGSDGYLEPVRADLVAAPPDSPPRRGWSRHLARACRAVSLLLLVIIVWQVVAHFHWRHQHAKADNLAMGPPGSDVVVDTGQISVVVYYEALCSDSKRFIVDQLYKAYVKIPNVLHITLVPYGKAKTLPPAREGGVSSFLCQHGPPECHANLVHACGLRLATSGHQALSFVVCLLSHIGAFEQHAPECAEMSSFLWKDLLSCADNEETVLTMEEYGNLTRTLRPPLTSVPTVTVDGSQENQRELLSDFLHFVCEKYKKRTGTEATGCR